MLTSLACYRRSSHPWPPGRVEWEGRFPFSRMRPMASVLHNAFFMPISHIAHAG